jgi:DNA polymerase I
MTTIIFDLETNGFLDQMDRIHSLVAKNPETGETWSCSSNTLDVKDTISQVLMKADTIVGHNIIKFDIPAIQKIYPWFKPKGEVLDTMILARLFWPDIKHKDDESFRMNQSFMPRKLRGSYKLEAFGYRMGILKDEYSGGWEEWNETMQRYCEQDVVVTEALYKKALVRWGKVPAWLEAQLPATYTPWSDECVELEHQVQYIIARQENWGFAFDERSAVDLYAKLSSRREELRIELCKAFPPFMRKKGKPLVPKRDMPSRGYKKGVPFQKMVLVDFNPANNHHLIDRLKVVRGWIPTEFTENGQPKIDDSIISRLPYPEAPLISEYLLVQKRISQLAEGDEAWLKKVKNGRIHGGVVPLGAVTRRMTHLGPNLAQVPSCDVPYGPECRGLFRASRGYLLCGADADSLELRLLAGYMAAYDGGEYIEVVLKGDKKIGTDNHSVNCRALGMDPKKEYDVDGTMLPGRSIAKTWFYAFIYGGGAEKLGWIMGYRGDPNNPKHWGINKRTGAREDAIAKKAGAKSKKDFMTNLPALGQLSEAVQARLRQVGYLKALDGGKLYCRAMHSALNTLLQSAGAIVMKKALVILDQSLQREGFTPGCEYEFVVNVHDEFQIDVKPEHIGKVKQLAEDSIRLAGEHYKFRCPLAGNADEGSTWAQTH